PPRAEEVPRRLRAADPMVGIPRQPGARPETDVPRPLCARARRPGPCVLPPAHLSPAVRPPARARARVPPPGRRRSAARPPAPALDSARVLTDSAVAAEGLPRQCEWLDQVSDAIITCGADHQVMTWNSGAELTYGYSSAEAHGCDADALLATGYRTSSGEPVSAADVFAALTRAGRWSGELRQRRADGAEIELLCSLTELLDEDRRPVGWVAVNRDVTDERHKARMALHDPL